MSALGHKRTIKLAHCPKCTKFLLGELVGRKGQKMLKKIVGTAVGTGKAASGIIDVC
jgi:hypothetical protein